MGTQLDELMRNYSSGEDNDEYDTPNIVRFRRT